MRTQVRNEEPSDIDAIEVLTVVAFRDAPHSSQTEHQIISALRKAGALTLSLVAEADGVIVGHVALSPVSISDGSSGWYGLGPISVAPEYQRRGIGSQLVEGALAELHARNAAGCVVLGEPGYYGRFGFRAEPTLVLPGVPPEYFQSRVMRGSLPTGIVSYHEAFAVGA